MRSQSFLVQLPARFTLSLLAGLLLAVALVPPATAESGPTLTAEQAEQSNLSAWDKAKEKLFFLKRVTQATPQWADKSKWGRADLAEFYQLFPDFQKFEDRESWTTLELRELNERIKFLNNFLGAQAEGIEGAVGLGEYAATAGVGGGLLSASPARGLLRNATGSSQAVSAPAVGSVTRGGSSLGSALRRLVVGLIPRRLPLKSLQVGSRYLGQVTLDMRRLIGRTEQIRRLPQETIRHISVGVVRSASRFFEHPIFAKYISPDYFRNKIQAMRIVPSQEGWLGVHKWNGVIEVTEGVLLQAQRSGRLITGTEHVTVHELIHGIARFLTPTYYRQHRAIHEGFTEFLARTMTAFQHGVSYTEAARRGLIPGSYPQETAVAEAIHRALVRGYKSDDQALDALLASYTGDTKRLLDSYFPKSFLSYDPGPGWSFHDYVSSMMEQGRYDEIVRWIDTYWYL